MYSSIWCCSPGLMNVTKLGYKVTEAHPQFYHIYSREDFAKDSFHGEQVSSILNYQNEKPAYLYPANLDFNPSDPLRILRRSFDWNFRSKKKDFCADSVNCNEPEDESNKVSDFIFDGRPKLAKRKAQLERIKKRELIKRMQRNEFLELMKLSSAFSSRDADGVS
jgi:hypothetical protein